MPKQQAKRFFNTCETEVPLDATGRIRGYGLNPFLHACPMYFVFKNNAVCSTIARRFPLSRSEGERVGVGGLFLLDQPNGFEASLSFGQWSAPNLPRVRTRFA